MRSQIIGRISPAQGAFRTFDSCKNWRAINGEREISINSTDLCSNGRQMDLLRPEIELLHGDVLLQLIRLVVELAL